MALLMSVFPGLFHEKVYAPSFQVCGFRIYTPILTSVVSDLKKRPTKAPLSSQELRSGCRLGTDSHAEVTCYGRHARITHIHEGMISNVAPFHDSYAPIENVNFANACFAYDGEDGKVYILHHRYGLDFSHSMNDSLLCTNQTRAHGVIVDDVPKIFDRRASSSQSIIFPDSDVELPLSLHNSIAYLPVRYPTDEDMNDGIDLFLSDDFPWDPTLFSSDISQTVASIILDDSNDSFNYPYELSIGDILHEAFTINSVRHTLRPELDAEKLADLWHVSIQNAARTLKCVDLDRIREIKGRIHKRFKTKVHQRRYNQLGGYLSYFASDTFKSNVVSLRGNKYMQLFCNRANFCVCYPLKKKSDAYHALDRL